MNIKKLIQEYQEQLVERLESYSKQSDTYCKIYKELLLTKVALESINKAETKHLADIKKLEELKFVTPPIGLFGEDLHGEIDNKIKKLK